LGTRRDGFLAPLREGINFFIWVNFYKEFERGERCKKRPCKQAALSIGPCWGTWRGLLQGLLKRKRECISAFLFRGTQRTLKVKSGGYLEL